MTTRTLRRLLPTAAAVILFAAPAAAQDRMCDPGAEDCRAILINYIRAETVGIDVGFWFMEDARYTTELIRRHQAGVPVRVLMDPRANADYPLNADRLAELAGAGIPMRKRLTNYILHWKTMIFHGQDLVEFSGANYSADAWRPATTTPYQNYTDESICFTSDPAFVDSFRTRFEDYWVNTTEWANYANITAPLARRFPVAAKDPALNFPPSENYRTRAVSAYNAERRKIDVIMYRITDRQHADAMIAAEARGVQVRLITEPAQYRLASRMWHAWNVDRMYMAGVSIKVRAHAGLNHQKSVILYDQNGSASGDQSTVIFGSSNWTSPSANGQVEHNLFTGRSDIVTWFVAQFERKWNNTGGVTENTAFTPLAPDAPVSPSPGSGATGQGTSPTLRWFGGPWAHFYDVYVATNPDFTSAMVFRDLAESSAKTATSTFSFTLPVALNPGTTYYWRVVGKTMAAKTRTSATWTFTTAASSATPSSVGGDVVLYAARAATRAGAWRVESDTTAAGGSKMRHPNSGAAKVGTASASPANYFELTFNAEAGRPYRLWIRGKADANYWANDSVFVQFNDAVTSGGTAQWRIGTTSAAEVNIEDCNGCGLSAWGWQDNGYGAGVLGPVVYFRSTGQQRIRIQTREDGLAIDQIILSPATFLNSSPGMLRNDTRILGATN